MEQVIQELREYFDGVADCPNGCYKCCYSKVRFSDEEWERIKDAPTPSGKGKNYCEYLDKDGKCTIYEERPIVCRAMGKTNHPFLCCKYIKQWQQKDVPQLLIDYLNSCKRLTKNGIDITI